MFELEAVSAINHTKSKKIQQTQSTNLAWGLYAQKQALHLVLSRHPSPKTQAPSAKPQAPSTKTQLGAFLFWSRAPFAVRAADGSVILYDARFYDPRARDRFSVALPDVRCEELTAP